MEQFLSVEPWRIVEVDFHPARHSLAESIFSIGNGRMGQRGMFEESYSGPSLHGSYLAGVYYPDKTRVGWWKNGYPESFAKVVNSVDWKSVRMMVNGTEIDLYKMNPAAFCRILDMRNGVLSREFTVCQEDGTEVQIHTRRFYSMVHRDFATMEISITAVNRSLDLKIDSLLNTSVFNQDANYDEQFWEDFNLNEQEGLPVLLCKTKKTDFDIAAGMRNQVSHSNGGHLSGKYTIKESSRLEESFDCKLNAGETICLTKYVVIKTSFFYPGMSLSSGVVTDLEKVSDHDFNTHLNQQTQWWSKKWEESDIEICGDDAAQQAIRFNIFQLNQTYTGEHPQLNIGPKGFTGEKYGGSTYWDTEAYCLPFYLATSSQDIALNLLLYRYKHLSKAIENAAKLGFDNGAALYPMVTMNGEESHNEWEITFEEIHRNGAIAYAIYDYTTYTGDESYLLGDGMEVLVGIARFWAQRTTYSEDKQQYVILGVTGPNEYENNVNNNWYTNYLAVWCLKYTILNLNRLEAEGPDTFSSLCNKLNFNAALEIPEWQARIDKMYYPIDTNNAIFLQQEGYLDKEQILVKDLNPVNLPLNQKWSWDRILRSCFIKQADVLQGLYFFENEFTTEEIRRNFDFYEPRTVHESSLSPCIHAILAAAIGDYPKAYEMYIRTARLDLDNYNNDTEDGLHITSMAGTWMAVVKGIGGMRIRQGKLHLSPFLPNDWDSFQFNILFRANQLKVRTDRQSIRVMNVTGPDLDIVIYGELISLKRNQTYVYDKKVLLA